MIYGKIEKSRLTIPCDLYISVFNMLDHYGKLTTVKRVQVIQIDPKIAIIM
jgi:hypothetical protein